MKYAFILAEKANYPVTLLCSVLGVSRSGLHAWRKRPTSKRKRSNAQLAVRVAAVHERSRKAYGSPRVHAELKAQGVNVGKKRVERLMRENGLRALRKRRLSAAEVVMTVLHAGASRSRVPEGVRHRAGAPDRRLGAPVCERNVGRF